MKKTVLFFSVVSLLFSCGGATHPDAEALCNCYSELHKTYKEEDVDRVADSCNAIYANILEKYTNDPEGKKSFEEAYDNCQ